MKIIQTLLCILFISTVLSSQIYTVTSTLSGANEVPPNMSLASGTLTGTYNANTNSISLNIPYTGLESGLTAAHLHKAPQGQNGGVIVNLNPTTGMTSGTIAGNYNVAGGDEAELIAGNVYVNLHTSNDPGGEIRGQLTLVLSSDCEIEVESGDLCINDKSKGIVLKSPNGTCFRIQVDNNGNLTSTIVSCP